jgi:hypothetical protein
VSPGKENGSKGIKPMGCYLKRTRDTKHLLVKRHHFRDYVTKGEISIQSIRTHDQQADYLTKPVNEEILTKRRQLVQGW